MDFKGLLIDFLADFLIVIKRFFLLIFFPYRTLRKISKEKDIFQLIIIFLLIFLYFWFTADVRLSPISFVFSFFVFIFNFLITVLFFYLFSSIYQRKLSVKAFIFSFVYSLFPTLIWFISSSFLYIILPPPRTTSFLGILFSIFFITFSLSLLLWRMILFYLAIRFSSKLSFNKIIYMIIVYLCLFIPYSMFLYSLKIFRIPFI